MNASGPAEARLDARSCSSNKERTLSTVSGGIGLLRAPFGQDSAIVSA